MQDCKIQIKSYLKELKIFLYSEKNICKICELFLKSVDDTKVPIPPTFYKLVNFTDYIL